MAITTVFTNKRSQAVRLPAGKTWDTFFHWRPKGLAVIRISLSGTRKELQTIGINDLHIAAHARSEGLVLVNRLRCNNY
jgi:predicted nucleic acid-binding protein